MQKQTKAEREAIFGAFINQPKYHHTSIDYQNVQNAMLIYEACLDERICPRLDIPKIVELVAELDLNGALICKTAPQVVVKEVVKEIQVEKPLSKIERMQQAGLNPKVRTEFDRNRDASGKPAMSQEQLAAVAADHTKANEIVGDVLRMIRSFVGRTHARTYGGREALQETFKSFGPVTTEAQARKLETRIKAEIDALYGSDNKSAWR
jgi:hypothetical protein